MQKRSILAFCLALSLVLPLGLQRGTVRAESESDDSFATQDQLDELAELQRREAELASRQQGLENDMAAIRDDVAYLQSQSADLGAKLDELRAKGVILEDEYKKLVAELESAKKTMQDAISAYESAKQLVEDKQVEYQDRLVAMYKRSKQSKLEVLLSSDGITGFFTNLELLGVIGRSDKQILEDLTAAREMAEAKKKVAEDYKTKYDAFVARKKAQIEKLAKGIRSTQDDIESIQSQILNRSADLSQVQGLYADTNSEITSVNGRKGEIEADIHAQAEATRAAWAEATRKAEEEAAAAKAAEEAARKAAQAEADKADQAEEAEAPAAPASPNVGVSGMLFPAPGHTYLSSYYGWRPYPLDETQFDFHSGLDFPGWFDDPIVAVLEGTVVYVSYPLPGYNYGGSGLCNYIIVQHDNGLQTVYGHLKHIYVSEGQHVSQGEVIAGMGSTGYSTGPHLHFEVRMPGAANVGPYDTVDPYPYLFG